MRAYGSFSCDEFFCFRALYHMSCLPPLAYQADQIRVDASDQFTPFQRQRLAGFKFPRLTQFHASSCSCLRSTDLRSWPPSAPHRMGYGRRLGGGHYDWPAPLNGKYGVKSICHCNGTKDRGLMCLLLMCVLQLDAQISHRDLGSWLLGTRDLRICTYCTSCPTNVF
jgi:hypothetical protein